MKLRFLVPLLAVFALFFVACEIEDDEDTVTPPPTCEPACAEGESCVNGVCQAGTVYLNYRFVRIDDKSATDASEDGGADIDAVLLFKGGSGEYITASDVVAYEHGGLPSEQFDSTEALGAPDAFYDYPITETCAVDGGFVSLGGIGGYLVLEFAEGTSFDDGDTISVLEVGNRQWSGGTAIEDPIDVSVSVSRDPDTSVWEYIGGGVGPEISMTIQGLPKVEQ